MHDRFKKSDYIGGKLFLNIVRFKRQILQCKSLFFLIKGFSLCLLKHKTVSSWTGICKIYRTGNFLSHRQSQVKYVKQFTSKIRRLIWYYCIGLVLLHRFQIYCKTVNLLLHHPICHPMAEAPPCGKKKSFSMTEVRTG